MIPESLAVPEEDHEHLPRGIPILFHWASSYDLRHPDLVPLGVDL
jgi:hypothetical protein